MCLYRHNCLPCLAQVIVLGPGNWLLWPEHGILGEDDMVLHNWKNCEGKVGGWWGCSYKRTCHFALQGDFNLLPVQETHQKVRGNLPKLMANFILDNCH